MAAPAAAIGLYELGAYFFGIVTAWWIATHPPQLPSFPSAPSQSQNALTVHARVADIAQEYSQQAVRNAEIFCKCIPLCDIPVGTVCLYFDNHAISKIHHPCNDIPGGHLHMLISIVSSDCTCKVQKIDPHDVSGRGLCIGADEIPVALALTAANHPGCTTEFRKTKKNMNMA